MQEHLTEPMIEIEDANIVERSGTARSGNPFTIREQRALLWRPGRKWPNEITLGLQNDNPGWSVGNYRIPLEHNLRLNQFGSLELNRYLALEKIAVVDATKKAS